MAKQTGPVAGTKDDTWVTTFCDMCYAPCGVKVHRVDGVIVKVEGDPDFPLNNGKLCAKGQAALMGLYDPNRLRSPMKRTNPEKGVGLDPRWQEITWEEALDTVTQRLKKIRAEDPRKLLIGSWDNSGRFQIMVPWATAFGTPNASISSATYFCGNALHQLTYLTNGTFHSEIDLAYCNYAILFGNQHGFNVGVNPNLNSQLMAEARMRGMKLVVVDPVGTHAASKADEWIPIRPGTDAALALAMLNLLINEYGLYDAEFLRRRTNGPYLTRADGHYLRDRAGGKPLVWDQGTGRPLPFDQAQEPTLDGEYSVEGAPAQTAFHRLRESLRRWTPEDVEPITTVPAATVRRIAREYGEAASIGATIIVEGKELPFRPAAVNQYRGSNAHKHGTHCALSVQLLNLVIGNMYAVGGHRGLNLEGPSGQWHPGEQDGLLVPPPEISMNWNPYEWEVKLPDTFNMRGFYPSAHATDSALQLNFLEPGRYKAPCHAEALLVSRTNPIMSRVNLEANASALKSIPFVVYFSRYLDEVADFADIVLPDTDILERWDFDPHQIHLAQTPGTGHWYWAIRQPVVEPLAQSRDWKGVLLELADRVGFRGELYELLNIYLGIKQPHRLEPAQKYSLLDIFDRVCKSRFGDDKGMDWFTEHGYLKFKRTVEEIYPGAFISARYPVYYEQFLRAGEEVRAVTGELGIEWDVSDYEAVPQWKPCPAYEEPGSEYDLYAVNYKVPVHFHSWTIENPWLSEVGERHPYYYKIMINTETAAKKGLRDGDRVEITSEVGAVAGVVKVTQCIHPEVLGIAGNFGGWSAGRPIARGKGMHFNNLLPFGQHRIDSVSAVVDSCVRVKISKTERKPGPLGAP